MQRLRAFDLVTSPGYLEAVGCCPGDPRAYDYLNAGQERLLYDPRAPEEGWSAGWAEMAFLVPKRHPYITCPRGVARLQAIDDCRRPIPLSNQFQEYLEFGNGRMPKSERWSLCRHSWDRHGYTRNYACTFLDLDPSTGPQQIQLFALNPADTAPNPQTGVTPRVLVQGLDVNGNVITSVDNGAVVQGEFVTLADPYALSANSYSVITGIQKDQTQGEVQIWQNDPVWGISLQISTMEPTETTAWYRRYYLDALPRFCCPGQHPYLIVNQASYNQQLAISPCPRPNDYVTVTALAKLDLVPVQSQTDYFLIQSKEALTLAAQSVRMSRMDDADSKNQAKYFQDMAVVLLKGQIIHTEGKNTPASNFAPFGRCYGITSMR